MWCCACPDVSGSFGLSADADIPVTHAASSMNEPAWGQCRQNAATKDVLCLQRMQPLLVFASYLWGGTFSPSWHDCGSACIRRLCYCIAHLEYLINGDQLKSNSCRRMKTLWSTVFLTSHLNTDCNHQGELIYSNSNRSFSFSFFILTAN